MQQKPGYRITEEAKPERTAAKYGDRAERYTLLEAGHVTQNLLLQATALGLGAVPIGAFGELEVQQALGIPDDHQPAYVVPVGRPLRTGDGPR